VDVVAEEVHGRIVVLVIRRHTAGYGGAVCRQDPMGFGKDLE
jgi:hypothetical protein